MLPETTFEDLRDCNWRALINNAPDKTCINYYLSFSDAASKLNDDNSKKRALQLLADLCYMEIDWEDGKRGMLPIYSDSTGHTPLPQDLSSQHVEVLYNFLNIVDDPELKARIADCLWLKKCNFKFQSAQIALFEYKQTIENLKAINEPEAIKRLCRAINLAYEIGSGGKQQQTEILQYIETYVMNIPSEKANGFHYKLFEILHKRKYGCFNNLAAKCYYISEKYKSINSFYLMRSFLCMCIKFLLLSKTNPKVIRALEIQRSESFVIEANSADSSITKSFLLRAAIESFRKINMPERVSDLHRKLIKIQELIPSEMVNVRTEIDVTEMVGEAEFLVAKQTLFNAIIRLIYMIEMPDEDVLRAKALSFIKEHPINYLPTKILINENGKTTGRVSIDNLNDLSPDDDVVTEKMFIDLCFKYLIEADAIILPAIRIITNEHSPSIADIMEFTKNNIFVPSGHEQFYARGLLAGFNCDFVSSSLYLIPQIENSIRYVLRQKGLVITSTLNSSGVQKEIDLNDLLKDNNVINIFGKDMILMLRVVMTDKYGWNIRNLLAHGLISYEELQGSKGIFCWWIALRLIMVPILIQQHGIDHNC